MAATSIPTAATVSSLNSNRLITAVAPLCSLSPLQFPHHLRRIQIGDSRLASCTQHPTRFSHLVLAKKQTFSSFDDLLASSEKPLLVDFYATWCGPCQIMVPVLNEVSASLEDKIQVVKIDTEKYPSIADKYRIEALPTFIIFKDGEACDRFEGALTAEQLIKRVETTLQVKQ